MRLLRYLAVLALSLIGCGPKKPTVTELHAAERVKVKVLSDGKILADDVAVSLEELSGRFAALKKKNGTVWYYRESVGPEPPPNGMEVIKLVAENRLPITMSTKPDFSDAVGSDGVAHHR